MNSAILNQNIDDQNLEIDRLETSGRVRDALQGLMDVDRWSWDEQGILTLRGQLHAPADSLYRAIRARMEALGFTPFLRSAAGEDVLVATPGIIERHTARVGLPLTLFLVTIMTVVLTGAIHEYAGPLETGGDLLQALLYTIITPQALLAGIPFAATLMSILFTHEMGHYLVGRLRHAPVSLPYFIPLPPFISFTGTMGAVIVQREPMEDRRTVLEIGIAGPLAGLLVALPLLIYGLSKSTIGPPPVSADGYMQEGNSLLYIAAKWLVFRQYLPSNGLDVQLGPVAWGAWFGLLVTMLNMLPIGQLDGGHVAYALFGQRAHYLAYILIAACVVLGLLVSNTWLFWALLAFLIGPRHPAPLNDISRLSRRHVALAIFGLVVFALLLIPSPLTIVH